MAGRTSCTSVNGMAVTLCAPAAGTPLRAWQKTYALAVMTCMGSGVSSAGHHVAAALRMLLQRALARGRAVVVSRMSAVLTPWNSFWLMS